MRHKYNACTDAVADAGSDANLDPRNAALHPSKRGTTLIPSRKVRGSACEKMLCSDGLETQAVPQEARYSPADL